MDFVTGLATRARRRGGDASEAGGRLSDPDERQARGADRRRLGRAESAAPPAGPAPERRKRVERPDAAASTSRNSSRSWTPTSLTARSWPRSPSHGEQPGPGSSQDTVEADTPALADREAAREAALAGMRARTAQHAAKPWCRASAAPAAAPAERRPPKPLLTEPAAAAEPTPPGETPPPPEPGRAGAATARGLWPRFVAGLAGDHRRDDDRDGGQPARLPEGHRARAWAACRRSTASSRLPIRATRRRS